MTTSLDVRRARAGIVLAAARAQRPDTLAGLRGLFESWAPHILENAIVDLVDAGRLAVDADGRLTATEASV